MTRSNVQPFRFLASAGLRSLCRRRYRSQMRDAFRQHGSVAVHRFNARCPRRLRMRLFAPHLVSSTLGAAALAMLSACGGGSSASAPVAPPVAPTATHLTGTAAVGAPMTQGKLRVLDATGTVVAHDIVINADGSYDAGELSGTAPWRIEACGYAG